LFFRVRFLVFFSLPAPCILLVKELAPAPTAFCATAIAPAFATSLRKPLPFLVVHLFLNSKPKKSAPTDRPFKTLLATPCPSNSSVASIFSCPNLDSLFNPWCAVPLTDLITGFNRCLYLLNNSLDFLAIFPNIPSPCCPC